MNLKVYRENLRNALMFLPGQLAVNAGNAMEQSRGKFEGDFDRDRLNFPKSGAVQPPGGGLRRQSGDLSRSFQSKTWKGPLDSLKVVHQSVGVKYAAIHEYGGRHTPARLGFFDAWEDHIENDLMPRLHAAVAKTVKDAGFRSNV